MPFGFSIIPTACTGVVQTFGRFTGLCSPGLNFYIPFIQKISVVSNRLMQNDFKFEVKTRDNVFTTLGLTVQYRIKPENTEKAFFSLDRPMDQIDAYIENVVRAKVPTMLLDTVFESQNEICHEVSENLDKKMTQYGYTIENTLVTEISPDSEVKSAMNKINATARLKEAAKNEADAQYIASVRQSEADRDRKALQGQGVALQREAIVKGYQASIDKMAQHFAQTGLTAHQILEFVTRIQELDTMETIGNSTNTKVLFFQRQGDNSLLHQVVKANES